MAFGTGRLGLGQGKGGLLQRASGPPAPPFVATGLPIWQAAMRTFLAGGAAPTVLFLGDSTTAGLGAAGNGLVGAKPFSMPYKFMQKLNAMGYPAQNDSVLGNAITTNSAGLIGYDSRISIATPTDWTYTNATLGGQIITRGTTAGSPFKFQPDFGTDAIDIYTPNVAAGGGTVSVNGGTFVGSIPMTNGGNTLTKSTFSFPYGANLLEITVSGSLYWTTGFVAYSTANKRIRVLSGGRPSGTIADGALATSGFSSLNAAVAMAPKLTFIWLGENDAATHVALATSQSGYNAIATALKAAGSDLVYVVPLTTQSPTVEEQPLRDWIISKAATDTVVLYNTVTGVMQGSWAAANTAGLIYDQGHFNAAGYDAMATALLNLVTH